MTMLWKLRVKDFGGTWHVHRFAEPEAAYRHWTLYAMDGTVEAMSMWKRTNMVVTGETGEEVWVLVQSYNKGD